MLIGANSVSGSSATVDVSVDELNLSPVANVIKWLRDSRLGPSIIRSPLSSVKTNRRQIHLLGVFEDVYFYSTSLQLSFLPNEDSAPAIVVHSSRELESR